MLHGFPYSACIADGEYHLIIIYFFLRCNVFRHSIQKFHLTILSVSFQTPMINAVGTPVPVYVDAPGCRVSSYQAQFCRRVFSMPFPSCSVIVLLMDSGFCSGIPAYFVSPKLFRQPLNCNDKSTGSLHGFTWFSTCQCVLSEVAAATGRLQNRTSTPRKRKVRIVSENGYS